jgi:hypothetical protein
MGRWNLTALSCLALFASIPLVNAQTESQLAARYAKLSTFAASASISLTAKYGSSGGVCEMVLEPRRWNGERFVLNSMSEQDVIRVVEEAIPLAERGARIDEEFDRFAEFSGHGFTKRYPYEKITIEVAGTQGHPEDILIALVSWKGRSCSR